MKIQNKSELNEDQIENVNNGVPLRYKDAWIDDVDQKIKDWYVFGKTKEKRGLFIYGKCGTGKTHTMQALRKKLKLDGFTPTFWNSTELSAHFREEAKENNQTLNWILDDCKVLMIDDFCAEKYSEFLEECFYRIINYYWERMIPIIISSNFSLKEISERIGDRIASRIAGMCTVIEIDGDDKRI